MSPGIAIPRTHPHDSRRSHLEPSRLSNPTQGGSLSVARVTEISAESTKNFEDAIRTGIARASKTIRNMKSAWVKEESVTIDGGEVKSFRVVLKVTFMLDE